MKILNIQSIVVKRDESHLEYQKIKLSKKKVLLIMMQKYQIFSILKVGITEKKFIVGLDL
ncbi:hypothetical protein AB2T78_09290 [Clostridium butyricum]|uniref:hypothetical protein n=1 Tax=Clostridium butyricum TaxID=1492 RepID=UPI003465BC4B